MSGSVASIERNPKHRGRVTVSIGDREPVVLSQAVAEDKRLRVGQVLGDEDIAKLLDNDRRHRCRDSAIRFLAARPRSADEVRRRLGRAGYSAEVVDGTLAWLQDRRLLDDTAFAEFWRDNRQQFRPRSTRLLRAELRAKGIDREIAESALGEVDESDAAYRAAAQRARRMTECEPDDFRRRLGQFLARRGFDWDTSVSVIDKLWRESRSLA